MNVKMNIPFSPPDMSEEEVQEVADAMRSGWITTGPKTKEFERKISNFCHTNRAVALGSATAAMELTLRVLGVGPGDEVIIPAYTYTATASAAVHVGATVRMIDSQANCVEMDYNQMAEAINEHTKVIVPVDLGGLICDYDTVFRKVEEKRSLFKAANKIQALYGRCIVMADAAHAYGSSWHGKMAGEIADFTCFSFHAVKNFTTAEGGAVTWRSMKGLDDEALYHQFQLYSLHGQSKDALAKSQLGAWEYDIVGPWYKCNMTDIMAGIGLAQMRRYPWLLSRRRAIIEQYDAAFADEDVTMLHHYTPDYRSNGHLYMVRLNGKTSGQRNELIIQMAQRGVATNVHFKPLPMMTGYKALGFSIKDYPNAQALFENEVTLPLYSRLTDAEVAYIITNFKEVLHNV